MGKRAVGKKKVNLYVDSEAFDTVQAFLEEGGQSVSSWLSGTLEELAGEIKGQPSPLSKPIDEMTMKEFGQLVGYWWRKAKGVDDGEKSKRG